MIYSGSVELKHTKAEWLTSSKPIRKMLTKRASIVSEIYEIFNYAVL